MYFYDKIYKDMKGRLVAKSGHLTKIKKNNNIKSETLKIKQKHIFTNLYKYKLK